MSKGKQVSATVSIDIYKEIEDMSEKERRSISEMTSILLENAVKERQRKRKKNAKEI